MEFVLIKAVAELMVYQGVVKNNGEMYFFFATVGPDRTIRDITAHSLNGERIITVEGGLREEIKKAVYNNFLQD